MPLSIYQKFGIEKVNDTKMSLKFVYHCTKHPHGTTRAGNEPN